MKLRNPFVGGRSHTLASLLHSARSRKSLNQIAACKTLPDPGNVAVAVFGGEKFTATGDKDVGSGQMVHTMWGWLAWQLGPKAFKEVKKHDADRVSPSGDEIKAMLETEGRPVLLLLDEDLKYMERAAAVGVKDSTLQRQAKDFIQNLTVEVSNSKNAVMVYSLQWSAREALGNVALLEELDKLTSRKDQVREPVTGDEVLAVVKRPLLIGHPSDDAANQVAAEYRNVVGNYWRARAETTSAKQDAEEQAIHLKSRMELAYPFHPALIDVMNSRWTSVDGFQRTRGALRFLATCLHALKKHGGAKPLLGPAEIPLNDPEVVRAMLNGLDPRQDYSPVITHDLVGANARAKRIDDRLSKETPAFANVRPALRLATAILAYSFGGRDVSQKTDALPDILEPLNAAAQTAILGELAQSETRIVVQLAQLGDMLKHLQDNSQPTKKVADPKPEFEIQPGTVLRTTVVRTSPREAQFGVDLSLVNRRTTMTTVVNCEILLEYAGTELWARVRLRGNLVLPRHGGAVQVRAESPLVSDIGGLPKLVGIRVKTIQDGDPLLKIVDQQLWENLSTGK